MDLRRIWSEIKPLVKELVKGSTPTLDENGKIGAEKVLFNTEETPGTITPDTTLTIEINGQMYKINVEKL